MVNIRKTDVVSTFRARFKRSNNERLKQLSKNDIHDLLNELGEGISDILAAAPLHGFDGLGLGAGQIKVKIRNSQNIKDIKSGEDITTLPTALYYYKPSVKHKARMKEVMQEYVELKEKGEL